MHYLSISKSNYSKCLTKLKMGKKDLSGMCCVQFNEIRVMLKCSKQKNKRGRCTKSNNPAGEEKSNRAILLLK